MGQTACKQPPQIKPTALALGSFGLAVALSGIFTILTRSRGMLFSGLDTFLTIGGGIVFALIATAPSNAVFRRVIARFGWRIVWATISIYAIISVMSLSWTLKRQYLEILMQPMAVPDSVRVNHGRSILFSSFVHFTASPKDIAALIRVKELIEVPEWDSDRDKAMPEGFSERERAQKGWEWWQPKSMPGAVFYYRHHKSDAPQGWSEGWWINEKTNEVFAYISG